MTRLGKLISLFGVAGIVFASGPANSGAYVFAGEGNGVDVVTHPTGYTGTGGTITVSVCIAPGSTNAGSMAVSVQNIVDRFNLLVATRGNLKLGGNNDIASNEIDFESVAVHEVGHCIGLAHPNLASESMLSGSDRNYTKTTDGANDTFDINDGSDNVIGSADDLRGDDVNLHWFEIDVNDPFDGPETPDSANYSRDLGDLPSGDNFAANGDRSVATELDYPPTEAVMQQGSFLDEDQRALAADDVATLKHARAGIDREAGNGDDYTVVLDYGGEASGCDVNLEFDAAETAFAVCKLNGLFLPGDNVEITQANSFYDPGSNWHFSDVRIPLPSEDLMTVGRSATTSELSNGDDSLLDNDVDQENGSPDLSATTTLTIEPTAGTLTLASDGTFDYEHDGGPETSDSFVYEVCVDGTSACSHQRGVITIIPNTPPEPSPDDIDVAEGATAMELSNSDTSLLDNDTDPDGDNLAVTTTPAVQPLHGSVTLETDGTFTYIHGGSENFADSFQYEVCDDGSPTRCANGSVTVSISEVNDAPIAAADVLSDVPEDSGVLSVTDAELTGNDQPGPGESAQSLTIINVDSPTGGVVELNGATVTFIPAAEYSGTAGFSYTVEDDGTTNGSADPLTDSTSVSFDVTEVNDLPNAMADTLPAAEEDAAPISINFALLLDNDAPGPANESGQSLTVSAVSDAQGGTVSIVGGDVVFVPLPDFNGAASFVYTAQDDGQTNGSGDPQTAVATAAFDITSVNDVPEARADSLAVAIEPGASTDIDTSDLLSNDLPGPSDEAAQALTVTSANNAYGGTVSLSGDTVTFTADAGFTGVGGFDYTVTDDGDSNGTNDPKSSVGRASLAVMPANSSPFPRADVIVVQRGGSASALQDGRNRLSSNDLELDGDGITVSIQPVAAPVSGVVTLGGDGSFSYTHGGDASAFDAFDYEVCDNLVPTANCSTGTVTVAIVDSATPQCSTPGRRAQAGEPLVISYQDAFNAAGVSFAFAGLPASLSVDENAGVISGTPTLADIAGSPYDIEISGTDGGGTTTALLSLTIEENIDAFFYGSFEGFCNPQ